MGSPRSRERSFVWFSMDAKTVHLIHFRTPPFYPPASALLSKCAAAVAGIARIPLCRNGRQS
jgi:hypothetical protein